MSILRAEKIIIKPVEENVASWIPEGKDGRVRWENTSQSYDAPRTSYGVAEILTKEEQAELEKEIDSTRPKGWLSVYAKTPGIWIGKGRYKLDIPADGVTLNLMNPIDYIKYKIALILTKDIAPSYEQREEKKYLYYMESESNIEKTEEAKVDKLMLATEYFTKIKDSKDKMRNLWLIINKGDTSKVPLDVTTSILKTKIFEYLNTRTSMFLNIVEDPDYKYKVLYFRALETGTFEKNGFEIRASYKNGKVIGNSMTDSIIFIKDLEADKENQQEFAVFLDRIKQ